MPSTDPSLIRSGRSLHAVGLGVTIALAVVPYVVAGLPMSAQNANLQRQIDKSSKMLELEETVRERHDKLSREAADHEQRRLDVLKRIPETADEGQFLGQLTELATTSSMRLLDYRPGAVEKKSAYSQMDVAVIGEGTYEQLCRYISGLERLPRYCRLAGATVERKEGELALLKITFNLRIFFASTPETAKPGEGTP